MRFGGNSCYCASSASANTLPLAELQGYLTDDDVFRDVS
jgi:hypothetical protein